MLALLKDLLDPGEDLPQVLGIGLGTLLAFGSLGTARAGFGATPGRWWIQLVAGCLGAVACYGTFLVTIRGNLDSLYGLVFIAGGGCGATVGVLIGDVVERKLLARIARYRNM